MVGIGGIGGHRPPDNMRGAADEVSHLADDNQLGKKVQGHGKQLAQRMKQRSFTPFGKNIIPGYKLPFPKIPPTR